MNSLEAYFKKLISSKRKLFLPYVTLGDPDAVSFLQILKLLEICGADAIEIGIPFSDPLADGKTIQKASQRALENNFNLYKGFKMLRKIKNEVSIPILFMSYYNPIFTMGEEKFFKLCEKEELDGLIIPDLPLEEAHNFIKKAKKINTALVLFISPTTSINRTKIINKKSTGFIYYISITGVTGARTKFASGILTNLKKVRKHTTKPLCVGFGISNTKQVKQIMKHVDGIIIGSAIVSIIEKNMENKIKMKKELKSFTKKIRKTLDGKNLSA